MATNSGAPYYMTMPEDTDPLGNVGAAIRQLVADLDAKALGQVGVKNAAGTSIAAGATATVNITFPVAFTDPPRAVLAVVQGFASGGGGMVVRQVDAITTTGCRIVLLNTSTSAATFSGLPVAWSAHP